MIKINLSLQLKVVNFFFIIFVFLFLLYPSLDIYISDYFFVDEKFISEKYTFIKEMRGNLKILMIIIPIFALFILCLFTFKKFGNPKKNIRVKFALLGFILGPILGCGLVANLYFKDTWGRARPVYISEFGGDKNFTRPFVKSDQCIKNCSWISGETSGAFSFMVGTIILRNHIFFIWNWLLGFLVFFCRLSMGGHFFSDNLFSLFLMIYLAYGYRYLVYLYIRNLSKG